MKTAVKTSVLILLMVMPVFADEAASRTTDEPLAGLEEYVEQSMREWSVPGLAIAVVVDNTTVFARGFGARKLGESEQVTEHTLFPIASCTKAFTAAAIGILVDEKKLHWDDPVQKHLPDFQLYDPFVTREITIRDLLAHRTGLSLGNKLWSSEKFTPDEIIRRMRFLQPAHSFRSRFSYNNLTYLVAGKIVERASGQPWDAFVKSRLIEPAKMATTCTSWTDQEDFAHPHAEVDGTIRCIELEPGFGLPAAPAGAIWSNAHDMAHWVRLNLANGRFGEERVFAEGTAHEMHSAQIVLPTAGPPPPNSKGPHYPKKNFSAYGLGWFVSDFQGKKIVEHSGTRNGYVSWTGIVPEDGLGFVVLANAHRTGINFALRHRILEAYLSETSTDWSTVVKEDYENGYIKSLREARQSYEAQRRPGSKPRLELARYAGVYQSELYGPITVRHRNDGLELDFGKRHNGHLEHWQDDTFRLQFQNPMLEDWQITFEACPCGSVAALHVFEAAWAPAWYDDSEDLGEFLRDPPPTGREKCAPRQ